MFIDRIRVKFLCGQSLLEIKGFAMIFLKGEGGSYVSPRVILNLVYAAGLPCVSAGSYSCDNN